MCNSLLVTITINMTRILFDVFILHMCYAGILLFVTLC